MKKKFVFENDSTRTNIYHNNPYYNLCTFTPDIQISLCNWHEQFRLDQKGKDEEKQVV